jgi:hypothetical protein
VIAAVRKALADDPFPRAPRLDALCSALAKLDPASVPRPIPPFKPLPAAPTRGRSARRAATLAAFDRPVAKMIDDRADIPGTAMPAAQPGAVSTRLS